MLSMSFNAHDEVDSLFDHPSLIEHAVDVVYWYCPCELTHCETIFVDELGVYIEPRCARIQEGVDCEGSPSVHCLQFNLQAWKVVCFVTSYVLLFGRISTHSTSPVSHVVSQSDVFAESTASSTSKTE